MAEREHQALGSKLAKQAKFDGATITTIDGLRADFTDGFGLVRASNTQPVLVFRFEGVDAAALKRIQEAFRTLLTGLRPDLTLPF